MSPLAAAVSKHASELARRELERRAIVLRSLDAEDADAVDDALRRLAERLAAALVREAHADRRLAAALASIYAAEQS